MPTSTAMAYVPDGITTSRTSVTFSSFFPVMSTICFFRMLSRSHNTFERYAVEISSISWQMMRVEAFSRMNSSEEKSKTRSYMPTLTLTAMTFGRVGFSGDGAIGVRSIRKSMTLPVT